MTHLPIWYLGKINSDDCETTILELSELQGQAATMGSNGEVIEQTHRNTKVTFAPFDYWLSEQMEQIALQANQACRWDYSVTGREAIQFAEYGLSQHYRWHTDTFTLSGNPLDRKITAVCLLNDPSEFEGGQFKMRLYDEYIAPLEKGTVIAFPSILEHCVTPVTSGTRYTATIWFNGPRFR